MKLNILNRSFDSKEDLKQFILYAAETFLNGTIPAGPQLDIIVAVAKVSGLIKQNKKVVSIHVSKHSSGKYDFTFNFDGVRKSGVQKLRLDKIIDEFKTSLRGKNKPQKYYSIMEYATKKDFKLTQKEAIEVGKEASNLAKKLNVKTIRKDENIFPNVTNVKAYPEDVIYAAITEVIFKRLGNFKHAAQITIS